MWQVTPPTRRLGPATSLRRPFFVIAFTQLTVSLHSSSRLTKTREAGVPETHKTPGFCWVDDGSEKRNIPSLPPPPSRGGGQWKITADINRPFSISRLKWNNDHPEHFTRQTYRHFKPSNALVILISCYQKINSNTAAEEISERTISEKLPRKAISVLGRI